MYDQGTYVERLREAVRGGTSDVMGVAHEVGASAAQTGIPLHEVLDLVERAYAPAPPDVRAVRQSSLAWAECWTMQLADVSCADPLTSLASVPYLRSRLDEVYRGAGADQVAVADTHALVVVELPRTRDGHEIEQALLALEVAEVLRTVFGRDETLAQLTRRRFAALARRQHADDVTMRLLSLLVDRVRPRSRLWVERLPSSADGVTAVLAGLADHD